MKTSNYPPPSHAPMFLIMTTSILFILYMLVTIRAFLSLPELPSDLFSRSLSRQPLILSQRESALRYMKHKHDYEMNNNFPQTIKDETFENIPHPGIVASNQSMNRRAPVPKISVPKFWSPPGGREALTPNGQLMTKEAAQLIGSKIEIDGEMKETIYASIASYRDFQCPQTVASLFSRAKYPQRIRLAIIDQIDDTDPPCIPKLCTDQSSVICQFHHQIDVYTMQAQYAIGPVFARHLGHRLYRGEYFAMQIDAHVDFVNQWDESLVNEWKSTKNEMATLTTYLSDIQDSIDSEGNRKRMTRPIMCESDFEGQNRQTYIRHGQQPEGIPRIHGIPTLEPYWAAGFSFARGHFVVNVPYDQHLPMIFQGEEISIGLRGFTYGYDYYTPEKSVCFHWYAHGDHVDARKTVKLFWEHAGLYPGAARRAMFRLNGIIHMNPQDVKPREWDHVEQDKYGLGKVRKVDQFWDVFGIHMDTRTVEHHLCRFVGPRMQNLFLQHLREDGMGIDYDKIDYRWVDPQPETKGRD